MNIERCGQEDYRAPTDEERQAFRNAKADKPKEPTLINPTLEDAKRLQKLWNDMMKKDKPNAKDRQIVEMTQKQYTGLSKHEAAGTVEIAESGKRISRYVERYGSEKNTEPIACKIRIRHWYMSYDSPDAIVVLTDKPQKPLPLDWDALEEKPVPAGQLF